MRIYSVAAEFDGKEQIVGWTRREVQAKKAANALNKKFINAKNAYYTAEDIGPGKGGLIEWLNGFITEDPEIKNLFE